MSGIENGTRSTAGSTSGPAATSHTHGNRSRISSTQSSTRKNKFERRPVFEKNKGVKHLTYSEMMD